MTRRFLWRPAALIVGGMLAALAPVARAQELTNAERMLVGISETVQRVAVQATPKTVAIKIHVQQFGQTGEGWGTGALISADGYILTCAHVVEPGNKWTVILADGTEYDAQKIGINSTNDYCLIKIDAQGLPFFTIGDSTLVGIRQWVVALGHPGGPYKDLQPAVAVGRVTGLGKQIPIGGAIPLPGMPGAKFYDRAIQHDAPIFSGNSGGPLVDLEGLLIGINGAILLINENAYATPIDEIMADLPQLKAGKEVKGRAADNPMAIQQELLKEVDPKDLESMFGSGPMARMFGAGQNRGVVDQEAIERNRKRSRTHLLQQAFTTVGAAANRATVEIHEGGARVGFGVVVGADGRILTNDRLLGEYAGEAKKLTVRTADGKEYPAKVVGRDGQLEVALLAVEGATLVPARWGDSRALTRGEWLLTGGGEGASPRLGGVVSATGRAVEEDRKIPSMGMMSFFGPPPNKSPVRPYDEVLQHDTPLDRTDFGSPLFSARGEFVGLNCGQFYRGSSYAIPAHLIRDRMKALADGVRVEPPAYQKAEGDMFSQLFGGGGEGGENPLQKMLENLFGGGGGQGGPGGEGGNPLQRMLENLFGGGQGGPGAGGGPPPGGAYLGVQIDPNSQDGVTVVDVVAGEAAATGGLQAGDRIVAIDGGKIASFDDLRRVLGELQPGDEIMMEIRRTVDGAEVTKTLAITLGERK